MKDIWCTFKAGKEPAENGVKKMLTKTVLKIK